MCIYYLFVLFKKMIMVEWVEILLFLFLGVMSIFQRAYKKLGKKEEERQDKQNIYFLHIS